MVTFIDYYIRYNLDILIVHNSRMIKIRVTTHNIDEEIIESIRSVV